MRICCALMLLCASVNASDFACAPAATGSGDGSDWSNIADFDTLTLIRGNTYYLRDSDGTNYSSKTFNVVESGSTFIFIKKATESAHGPATGWVSSMGNSEAVFSGGTPWTITRGYYDFDGVFGEGKDPGGFGIRLVSTDSLESTGVLVDLDANRTDQCKFRHIEFDWNNGTTAGPTAVTRYMQLGSGHQSPNSGTLIQYNYMHHSSGFGLYAAYGMDDYTVEHNYFYRSGGGGGESAHWETFWNTEIVNFTFRYNTVDNVVGVSGQTGWLMVGSCSNVFIYGNVFSASDGDSATGNNGTIGTWSNDEFANTNVFIINNTFVDLESGGLADPKIYFTHNTADDTNVRIQNNLIFGTAFDQVGGDTITHNAFGGGGSPFGTSQQTGLASTIFVNYAGDNYRLSAATTAADNTVGATYNTDPDGVTRGADGTWDRGAFEFSAGSPPVFVQAPSGLRWRGR